MTTVAVIGASGFIGRAVASALASRGATVVRCTAPRLTSSGRSLSVLETALESSDAALAMDFLSESLADAGVVVNAAGLATPTADGDELFGANALLPGVVARAAPEGARVIHLSSAAVQGRREPLDESMVVAPFSPYSRAKALGEELIRQFRIDATSYRPTSVHGAGRPVTRSLARVLSSPLASVAGSGDRPTPQVLVENVADAVATVALGAEHPPPVVLQPWEGMTTGQFVRVLGAREPWHVPVPLARALVMGVSATGRIRPSAMGLARRLEMMWFGQSQTPGWLNGRWTPAMPMSAWRELR